VDTIIKVGNSHFIINHTPTVDAANHISGVVISLKAAYEVQQLDTKLRRELRRKGNVAKHHFPDIVGRSEQIVDAVTMARKFADTNLTILLEGDSGTGKELQYRDRHRCPHCCGNQPEPLTAGG
jgi:propionate catabolism operon transcriptional regulator